MKAIVYFSKTIYCEQEIEEPTKKEILSKANKICREENSGKNVLNWNKYTELTEVDYIDFDVEE
jgi:hypothetical protein